MFRKTSGFEYPIVKRIHIAEKMFSFRFQFKIAFNFELWSNKNEMFQSFVLNIMNGCERVEWTTMHVRRVMWRKTRDVYFALDLLHASKSGE